MIDKASFFCVLRAAMNIFLRVVISVGLILILDVMGLGLYGFLMEVNAFTMLWFVVILESVTLMFLGVMGTTVLPQARVIGVPWSKSVRAATEEIREERQRQVSFWALIGMVGFILFIIALVFSSM